MVGTAYLLDPTKRYPLMGVQLERDLEALAGDDVIAVMVGLDQGVEVLPEASLGDEPAIQDSFELFMLLKEQNQAQTQGAAVKYSIDQMESEQWAWQEAQLDKLEARTQVFPRGLPNPPKITVPEKSALAQSDVWAPFMTFIWPKLSSGFLKAGKSSWTDQYTYDVPGPAPGQTITVNLKVVYRLENFVNTSHGVYATVTSLGTLSEAAGQDASFEVKGMVKGFSLVEPGTGRTSSGEYRLEQELRVKQAHLPVMRKTTYQAVKFWRPMFSNQVNQKPELPTGPVDQEAAGDGAK